MRFMSTKHQTYYDTPPVFSEIIYGRLNSVIVNDLDRPSRSFLAIFL